jgi:type IV secretion system protein VirD4
VRGCAMADDGWWKGIDPFPLGKPGGGSGGSDIGWKIGTAVVKAVINRVSRNSPEAYTPEQQERNDRILQAPPPVHGSAAWALPAEVDAAGLLKGSAALDDPSSILLGVLRNAGGPVLGQLHWDGEGHLLSVAPTRSGKSTMQIVPNLLRYRGSCIVLDPKGELYWDTAAWRRTNVGPVYRIAPFERDTHGFNPLATVRTVADARALADLIMPDDPNAQDYFKKDAVSFLSALILFVLDMAPPERQNLAEVRMVTAAPMPKFLEVVTSMSRSKTPAIANAAGIVLGKSKDRGLPGLRDTLNTELSLWDDPGLAAATSAADVDFHSLKDRPTTVYVSVPFDKTAAYAPFLKVLLSGALEAMVQNTRVPDIPVLFVLDEFLSLGPFSRFRDAIRTHAGYGVRLWFFLQDLPTLEEHYPKSWKAFFNTTVKTFFGTDETFTGQLVSEQLGAATVAHLSTSVSRNESVTLPGLELPSTNRGGSVTGSVVLTGRPLLTPAEVVTVLSGVYEDHTRESVVLVRGVRPIRARLVPWFAGRELRSRMQPLPSNQD